MAEQVVVALKITTDVKTGGITATIGSLQDLDQKAKKATSEMDKLSNTLSKKFSASDIGKSVLGGLGLGSGFAVAQQAASILVGYYGQAAERAKSIADHSERMLAYTRARIALEQSDEQRIATLQKEQAGDLKLLSGIQPTMSAAENLLRTLGFKFGIGTAPQLTKEQLADRSKTLEEVAARDNEIRAGQLEQERTLRETQAKNRAEEIDENTRIEAAQKRLQDAFKQSADAYREVADPQRKYQLQLAEIEQLMRTSNASGQPFLSMQDGAAAKARILAEMNDTAGKAIRATREEVEQYDIALAVLDKNPALSDQEKQRERIRLIDEQTAAIKRAKDALTEFMAANPGVDVGAITEALSRFGQQSARNAGDAQGTQTLQQRDAIALRDLNDPSKHYQDAGAGVVGGGSQFLAGLGTQADNVAQMIDGGLNAALGETSNFLFNLGTGAMSFREAWNGAILAVGQNFARMATDMVAKLIWRATVERALTALGVATHLGGEAAKTAGTGAGVATRLALVVKEALADVYHGAVAAFKALAGIPYVGPFLGAAAMAAAVAGGIALVGKIGGHAGGGIVQGGRQLSWLNEEGTEAVIRAPSVRRFGAGFLADLNEGVLNLDALPGNIAAQLPGAADQARSGGSRGSGGGAAAGGRDKRIIMLAPDLVSARQMARDPDFENVIVDVMRRRRGEVLDS
jgi:hypothetical protein